jgi:hypothetical protein
MYAAAFDYVRASSWAEAVEQLQQFGDEAHVIAGGQSLVPMMMLHYAAPSALVDLGGADERTIELDDGTLVLSALVRHVDLEHSEVVAEHVPMLTQAVRHIANVMGTRLWPPAITCASSPSCCSCSTVDGLRTLARASRTLPLNHGCCLP